MTMTSSHSGHMAEDWGNMDPQIYLWLLQQPLPPDVIMTLGDELEEADQPVDRDALLWKQMEAMESSDD